MHSGAPAFGVAVSPADSLTSPQKESVCCTTTAVPGLSCTYRVPRDQRLPKCVFYRLVSAGRTEGGCPEPIVLQSWQACMTLQHCLKGTFPPEVRLGLRPTQPGPAFEKFLWTHGRRAYELHSLGYVPFLSPSHPPPFLQNLRQMENLCSGKGRCDVS